MGFSQLIWEYPFNHYPYHFSVGENYEMEKIEGIKSKTMKLKYKDTTLFAKFEYDTSGRLIFKKDEYGDSERHYYSGNSKDWNYLIGDKGDTICERKFVYNSENIPIYINQKCKNWSSEYIVKEINDTLFETYLDSIPKYKYSIDQLNRKKTIWKFDNGWKLYLKYTYSEDTVQYLRYINKKPYSRNIGVFKKNNLIEITSIDLNFPKNTIRRKQIYKNDKLITTHIARIDDKNNFPYKKNDSFEYNSKGFLVKRIQYGENNINCLIEIEYEYY